MQELDNIQRFLFESADIRGEIVHLNHSFQAIAKHYPKPVQKLIGEALLAAVHLTASIKFEGQLTIQFQSTGPLSLLLAKCDHQFNIRAMARHSDDISQKDIVESITQGQMVINIEHDKQVKTYQSIVPLTGNSLSQSLEHYFGQSEQIATKLWFVADEKSACGMLLQLMPGLDSEQREEFWQYAIVIGETITAAELNALGNEEILHRLYHEKELRLFDSNHIQFKCQCSEQKMKESIKLLGKEDALQLIQEQNTIDVSCEFCKTTYQFDAIDVELLFKAP